MGRSARGTTVRVADGEPGEELQVDFGRMGLIFDPATGRRRVCWALIFTACYSPALLRVVDASPDDRGGDRRVRGGLGVLRRGVQGRDPRQHGAPSSTKADPLEPRFNQAFVEYAQARGFVVDPARVRTPQDKPRVERTVPFVRGSFFAGESFIDLADAQRRAEEWCRRPGRAARPRHHPAAGRPSCSPSRRAPAAARPGRPLRPADLRHAPRCTATITSRSPRRCTRSRAT